MFEFLESVLDFLATDLDFSNSIPASLAADLVAVETEFLSRNCEKEFLDFDSLFGYF